METVVRVAKKPVCCGGTWQVFDREFRVLIQNQKIKQNASLVFVCFLGTWSLVNKAADVVGKDGRAMCCALSCSCVKCLAFENDKMTDLYCFYSIGNKIDWKSGDCGFSRDGDCREGCQVAACYIRKINVNIVEITVEHGAFFFTI